MSKYSFCNNYLPTKIVFLLGYHDMTFTSRLSSLALSSVNIPTVGGARWSPPMVPAQLSVSLQQMEDWAPKPVEWTICFLTASGLACTLMIVCTSVCIYNCVFGSLMSSVAYGCVSADWGREWPVVACPSPALVALGRMLTIFACYVLTYVWDAVSIFDHLPGMFCPRTLLFE